MSGRFFKSREVEGGETETSFDLEKQPDCESCKNQLLHNSRLF